MRRTTRLTFVSIGAAVVLAGAAGLGGYLGSSSVADRPVETSTSGTFSAVKDLPEVQRRLFLEGVRGTWAHTGTPDAELEVIGFEVCAMKATGRAKEKIAGSLISFDVSRPMASTMVHESLEHLCPEV